ncbi:DUF934 domain-containing protein [Swaminathania salitolerans]|uniref:Oxidoreductase n=1 Tax=Swaminathania salitolerans TaxID=182838 RepID=A0A511BQA1_9PROT|nr:DUF934 domain-containing protein [Swaminathania salitolerans]GBQ15194.1 hypothetical protein AA21291_2089 [Swaminathania salitolerans LMG 21291]GEL02023.1 hypothetical protein SSA02_11860 [Swaminathania salitolerans]
MKRFDLSSPPRSGHDGIAVVPVDEMEESTRAVRLTPETDVEAIGPALAALDVVVVTFPVFRDGRGFTQARALREYYGFTGEIRAEGHILPDQARFLHLCGVDCVMLPEGSDPTPWQEALTLFSGSYQDRLGLR